VVGTILAHVGRLHTADAPRPAPARSENGRYGAYALTLNRSLCFPVPSPLVPGSRPVGSSSDVIETVDLSFPFQAGHLYEVSSNLILGPGEHL
jgi:hypothetical protein